MNICVYCSAALHIDAAYFDVARELGERMAQRGDTLVYGGASVGLMGEVARAVQRGSGRVIGVIPRSLVDREIAYHEADELIVTHDMRERKRTMETRSDAFLALPGGIGTLDEVFEIMNLRQLRLTANPLVLLNQDGFYTPIRELLERMHTARFLRSEINDVVGFADNVEDALAMIDRAVSVRTG